MFLQVAVFLAVVSVLVLIHELGHFLVGKISGIGVVEFALGLPFTKPVWSKKLKSGMKVSLYPILFGGFVNLLGEEQSSETADLAGSEPKGGYFYRQSVALRIAVVVAGVVMNFLLAIVLFYLFLGLSGFKVLTLKLADYNFISPHEDRVIVTSVQEDSPAARAGISGGQVVLAVDGRKVTQIKDFQQYLKNHADEKVKLTLVDSELAKTQTVTVVPRSQPPPGQGALGVGIGESTVLEFKGFGQKLTSGLSYGADMLVYNLVVIGKFVSTAFETRDTTLLSESVSGPIGIYSLVGEIMSLGGNKAVINLLNFVGLMSLSLAFMNVLPFPALDGGKLFLLIVEAVTKKKLSPRVEGRINQVGMAFLLGLILLISVNDLTKIFKR